MADEYKVYVVNIIEDSVVDESGPFEAHDEAINTADEYAASDRGENATGLGYEVVGPAGVHLSRVVYWTVHSGSGVVDAGEGQPPWHE